MKKFLSLLRIQKKQRKTLAEYQQEMLVRQGREQFKKLIDRGLGVPIGLL